MPPTEEMTENPAICILPAAVVEFAANDGGDKNKIRLTMYDGSVVRHWYWGNLAFEQKTMRMAKGRNPILFNHDTAQRIAFSDKEEFEPKFTLEGRFLKTSTVAEQVRSEMEEGFPFEASLRFDPDRSDIEYVAEGTSVEVNGKNLKGPGTIIRNAMMIEGSVVVFGALKHTKSQSFAENPIFKEPMMAKQNESVTTARFESVEAFAESQPDLHARIVTSARAEGVQSEQTRFAELREACGDDHELLAECYAGGKTVNDALKMANAKLTAALKEKEALAAGGSARQQAAVDPAIAEFKAAPKPGEKPAGQFDEKEATDEQLRKHFSDTKDLQDQFSGPDAYISYVRHSD